MEVMRRQRRVHNCLSGTVKFQERTKKHILVVQRAAQEGVGAYFEGVCDESCELLAAAVG